MEFSQTRFAAAWDSVQTCDGAAGPFAALHSFASLPSTNQAVWEQLAQGAPAGTAAIARQQTAGRGQWGKQWVSAPGGLYLSVALTPNWPVAASAALTLAIVWGVARSLRSLPGRLSGSSSEIPIQIKWLNDLVLNGRKLGGILTETRCQQERLYQAVVGVGINWRNPVPPPGITLAEFLSAQPTPLIESLELLAALTLHGILSGYQTCQQDGIARILPAYAELLTHRDRPLRLDEGWGSIVGVTAQGDLRVQLEAEPLTGAAVERDRTREVQLKPGTISLGYDLL